MEASGTKGETSVSAVKVSVVMPCYQSEGTLAKSVRSVQAQTIGDWELIAVDDGSRDNTLAVLSALAGEDTRIRVIHQENGGVSSARNTGIDAAKGEWIFFLDADDLLTEDALEVLLSLSDESLDVVCGAYKMRYVDEGNREEIHTCANGELQTVMESLIRGDSALNSMCARLYRRSVLDEHHIRAPRGVKIGEDVLFNLAFFAKARAYAMSDRVIYVYEFGGDSAMTRARSDVYIKSQDMLQGITAFIRIQNWETRLFRAHIDIYLRTLRVDRGRIRAAFAFDRSVVRRIVQGVEFSVLPRKQKLYYLVLRICPFSSILLP